jgi:RHS repeat-associated protein
MTTAPASPEHAKDRDDPISRRLHQNYFRDYDPAVGRYVESDPIGLAAGVNTYPYVGANPLTFVDPDGLDETIWNNTTGGRSGWDGSTNGNWGSKCWSGGQYSCGGHPMGKAPPTESADMKSPRQTVSRRR